MILLRILNNSSAEHYNKMCNRVSLDCIDEYILQENELTSLRYSMVCIRLK